MCKAPHILFQFYPWKYVIQGYQSPIYGLIFAIFHTKICVSMCGAWWYAKDVDSTAKIGFIGVHVFSEGFWFAREISTEWGQPYYTVDHFVLKQADLRKLKNVKNSVTFLKTLIFWKYAILGDFW